MPAIEQLIARLGIIFNDPRLLQGALVHSSFLNQFPGRIDVPIDSERLEFLGDAVLNFLVADLLFSHFPGQNEGMLTSMRAELIKERTLAQLARTLDLGAHLRLTKGEQRDGARERDALLADTFEAVVAAIYLDRGLDVTRSFLVPLLEPLMDEFRQHGPRVDFKTQLQAYIQRTRNVTPAYRILEESGPDHRRIYTIAVVAGEEHLGQGEGAGKSAAGQAAARAALLALGVLPAEEQP